MVDVWPDGETEVVKGFATEQQAAEWIAKRSEGWQGRAVLHEKPEIERDDSTSKVYRGGWLSSWLLQSGGPFAAQLICEASS